MACFNGGEPELITAGGQAIDVVQDFISYITNKGGSAKEVKRRLAIARQAAIDLSKIWKSHDMAKRSKIRLMNALVFSIALYGSETWTLTQNEKTKHCYFELWCWRRMLNIKWQDHTTNISVLERVHNPKSLVNTILQKKLMYFGHIARRDGENLEKQCNGRTCCWSRQQRKAKGEVDRYNIRAHNGGRLYGLRKTALDRDAWKEFTSRITTGRLTP